MEWAVEERARFIMNELENGDGNVSISDLADLLQGSSFLSERVIRAANTVAVREGRGEVRDVLLAAGRLGINKVQELLESVLEEAGVAVS